MIDVDSEFFRVYSELIKLMVFLGTTGDFDRSEFRVEFLFLICILNSTVLYAS